MTFSPRAVRTASLAIVAAVLAACGSVDSSNDRGALKSNSQTAAMPRAMIDATVATLPGLQSLIGGAAKCDVSINRIIYDTRDPKNNDAEASAGVLIPSGTGCSGPYPIVVYHHGTTVIKDDTMSSPTNAEMNLQLWMYAAQGYIVVMPDYHGYSGSTMNYHPYLQADITALVSIDALRATRKLLTDRSVATSGKLFLAGYSQGGHAAMATQRALEKDYTSEFTVTASVPMAGPYALAQTVLSGFDAPVAGATVFTPMALIGLQKRYGDVYTQASDVFQSPWVNGIESLLPGTITFNNLFLQGKLPLALTGPGGLLTSGFVSGYKADANYPARRRVAEHDLLNFKPKAVTTLCHGSRDPTVPVANMTSAVTYFASQGSTVGAVDVEMVPAFKPGIDAQVAAAGGLSTYHGGIVPPLCASVARSVFDPLR
jgi:acetyl esterase/lipase